MRGDDDRGARVERGVGGLLGRLSVLADIATSRIVGKGADGYREALAYLKEKE